MRAVDLIYQKRDGGALSEAAIRAFVAGVTDGSWPDAQIAALLMAIVLKGMTLEEAVILTDAMVRSGETMKWSKLGATPVDKHSTGGVGDKTSLVLAPLAAACGAIVPMMSGRGLGHTGGTLDKLEAIPGFRTRLSTDDMRRVLADTGCVMVGQTDEIAPADRRLYALRDVTGTVESIPLICASILSKKIAEGIGALVLDVKVGRGAFMKTRADARTLAEWLTSIAERHGVRTEALLTSMNAPLGVVAVARDAAQHEHPRGQAHRQILEVLRPAALQRLDGLDDFVRVADRAPERRVRWAIASGAGVEKFRAIIQAQGGDPGVVDDYRRLPIALHRESWPASRAGFVTKLDAELIGRAAMVLGAGRDRVDAVVNHAVGIEVEAPVGAEVQAGEPVLTLACDDAQRLSAARVVLAEAVEIGDRAAQEAPRLLETIDERRIHLQARSPRQMPAAGTGTGKGAPGR